MFVNRPFLKPDKIVFMVLTLKKIQHRGAYCIGICFPYSVEVNQKLRSLGAVYSSTLRCWYLDYHAANYQLLQSNFDELVIENPKPEHAKTVQVAGPQSRDLPPIVASENFSDKPESRATKLPEKANEKPIKGHKAENSTLAQKLNLQLFENIGKYWVFSMNCFTMSRYSVPHGCYLLPAAPDVYKALAVHYEVEKVILKNQLPAGYLKKENMPNRKQFLLQKAKNQVLEKIPESARGFMVAMMDAMLANNLSDSTIRNYGNAFCRFIGDNDYRDDDVSNKAINRIQSPLDRMFGNPAIKTDKKNDKKV